jgi:hypothetical protein
MSKELGLGQIITTEQHRDAIHIAVAPVTAAEKLQPGERIGFVDGSMESVRGAPPESAMGIVDPFLSEPVKKGQRFWVYLNPGSIRSLRHEWTHPAFEAETPKLNTSASESWMRKWAKEHISHYYGDDDDDEQMSEEAAYELAIEAGHQKHIGRFEDARDYIDDEWWSHWELITGNKGDRGSYFSCSC